MHDPSQDPQLWHESGVPTISDASMSRRTTIMATATLLESLLALDARETLRGLEIRPTTQSLARTATWDDLPWLAARRPLPVVICLDHQEPLPTSSLVRWLLRVVEQLPERDLTVQCTPRVAATLGLLGIDRLLGARVRIQCSEPRPTPTF